MRGGHLAQTKNVARHSHGGPPQVKTLRRGAKINVYFGKVQFFGGRPVQSGRIAEKIVDGGTAVAGVINVGDAAAAQMRHADFSDE